MDTYEVYQASEHHRSTSHSTTASPEWPRRRSSETSRHRTAKSRLRDGYACYRSRHGAHGSHVGCGSGTEAEIAPIRHGQCNGDGTRAVWLVLKEAQDPTMSV